MGKRFAHEKCVPDKRVLTCSPHNCKSLYLVYGKVSSLSNYVVYSDERANVFSIVFLLITLARKVMGKGAPSHHEKQNMSKLDLNMPGAVQSETCPGKGCITKHVLVERGYKFGRLPQKIMDGEQSFWNIARR